MRPIAYLAALLLSALAAPALAQRAPLPPPGPIEHINGNRGDSPPWLVPSVASRAFVDDINRRMANPCGAR